ncbi:UNKNOWN [Stylonychia lemnae]|uniref:HAUS augmin-like complex subunit 6 N-terminal domain-containing protein n=1 Tax=Stylonychia lemnae TaxID=5949 RepID=A0A078AJB1_STYLE|nr:UNKNOWN [Stylonychia lemnae]|eukprot:CDW82395.1 UNKNOWN [Stylonychia lemnae]
MALLLHELLCSFDKEEYTPMFTVCWFPYSMVELKEFKSVALQICQDLIKKGKLQSNIITKSVLESATGVRMWQALRSLSDYCLMESMKAQFTKSELKAMPDFIQNTVQLIIKGAMPTSHHSSKYLDENADPNNKEEAATGVQSNPNGLNLEIVPGNCNHKMLKRNIRATNVHMHQLMNEFIQKSESINKQQKSWVEFSTNLNDEYLKAKNENAQFRSKAKQLGLLTEDGYGFSELSRDLQSQGIQCIERIPQINEIRKMTQQIQNVDILSKDNLESNIYSVLQQQRVDQPALVLDQNTLFKNVTENEEKEKLRETLKYGYSKDVLSINMLLDQSLVQMNEMNDQIEANQVKKSEVHKDFGNQLDWLIQQHKINSIVSLTNVILISQFKSILVKIIFIANQANQSELLKWEIAVKQQSRVRSAANAILTFFRKAHLQHLDLINKSASTLEIYRKAQCKWRRLCLCKHGFEGSNLRILRPNSRICPTRRSEASSVNIKLREIDQKVGPFKFKKEFEERESFRSVTTLKPVEVDENAVYVGEWSKDGLRQGKGLQIWKDGSRYEGYWKNDMAQYHGRMIYPDGEVYDGLWWEDKAHGRGIYLNIQGVKYEGEWHQDQQHGQGIEYWPDGTKYVGQYQQGKKQGYGVYTFKDGSRYEGEISINTIHGKGKITFKDGRCYDGDWKNNQMEGTGKFTWSDGRCYQGQYQEDRKHGQGTMTWSDGKQYKGGWFNGKQHGQGTYKTPSQEDRVGEWEYGKLIKWIN